MAPVIASILTNFANIALRSRIRDDDAIDQLNHWASSGLLLALAIGTGAKQYVGDPIHCWVPALYKKKHFQKYSDSYCWIHPMYNVPMEDSIPFDEEERWFNDVGFYRWVFLMFILQAALFKFPNILWQELKIYSGLNVSKVVGMAWETSMMKQEERDEKMGHIAHFIDRWLRTYSQYKYNALTRFRDRFSSVIWCFGERTGTYISGLYMFTKLLYFVNVIGQFFLLSAFLDLNFWRFGIDAFTIWNKKGRWQDLYNFPRIGLCDYKVRQLENIQTLSVQCVLSINLFLEKMYLILWFWLVMLLVFNTVNMIQWIIRGISQTRSEAFLAKNLNLLGIDSKRQRKLFVRFTRNYLRTDGVFMLRIVADNTSEIMTLDLLKQLWKKFKESHHEDEGDLHKPNGDPVADPSAPLVEDNDDSIPPKNVD
ncbi:pannexin 6 [Aplysia californica]|uniref:Innexin n=1 Tax=Aplysia californica TaxID=6500 RepID=Q2VTE9_APLCA|nr:pannexin 6 [Aplysia californica]AAX24145.1 pannexin 6 [Aplysia californica]